MKTNLKNEFLLLGLVLIPFVYLFIIWNTLPSTVPIHWNISGDVDRHDSKALLWLIPVLLPFLSYLIFLLIPLLNKSNRLQKMGRKYDRLKFAFVFLTAVIATYILYMVKYPNHSISSFHAIIGIIGLLFAMLGNYFQVLPTNNFIGIRTPWTLRNEEVWKETHTLAGRFWFCGGVVIVFVCFFVNDINLINIIFLTITFLITLVPFIFSYIKYKKLIAR